MKKVILNAIKIVLGLVLLYGILVAYIFWNASDLHPIQPKKVDINFNFLTVPLAQAVPKVFAGGKWQELPLSHLSLVSEKYRLMAICGEGGFYVYNLDTQELRNLYEVTNSPPFYGSFPCTNVYFENGKVTVYSGTPDAYPVVYDSEKTRKKIFDLETGNLISAEDVTYKDVRKSFDFGELANLKDVSSKRGFREACDAERSLCAKLVDERLIEIFQGNDKVGSIESDKFGAVLAVRGGVLLYATEEGSCRARIKAPIQSSLRSIREAVFGVNKSYGCYINHYLHAYDIGKKVDEVVLKDFRFDLELLVFF